MEHGLDDRPSIAVASLLYREKAADRSNARLERRLAQQCRDIAAVESFVEDDVALPIGPLRSEDPNPPPE